MEYKIESCGNKIGAETMINKYVNDGWVLDKFTATMSNGIEHYFLVFKREN